MGLFTPGSGIVAGLLAGKPKMPRFDQIDLNEEQQKAIEGNQAALPGVEKIASGVNQFNLQQLDSMLNYAIPGFSGLKSGISSRIGSMVAGEIPDDVSQQVTRKTAGQALEGGFAGSGMGRNLTARDLGLTSLDLIDKGISSAENWFKTLDSIAVPKPFDVSGMFVTPGAEAALDVEERNSKFQHDWSKNIMDWQSSPRYLGAQELSSITGSIDSIAGSAAGGMLGGAAGGGGGGGGGGGL